MKLVIIGGTGLIGSKLVTKLIERGHEAVAAAPNTGVNTLTGEGLAEAIKARRSSSTSRTPVVRGRGGHGVLHHVHTQSAQGRRRCRRDYVALSVVGTERIPDSPYFRAKNAQKRDQGWRDPVPIVHAAQFFEFVKHIADDATDGTTVRLPPVSFSPWRRMTLPRRSAESPWARH